MFIVRVTAITEVRAVVEVIAETVEMKVVETMVEAALITITNVAHATVQVIAGIVMVPALTL